MQNASGESDIATNRPEGALKVQLGVGGFEGTAFGASSKFLSGPDRIELLVSGFR